MHVINFQSKFISGPFSVFYFASHPRISCIQFLLFSPLSFHCTFFLISIDCFMYHLIPTYKQIQKNEKKYSIDIIYETVSVKKC